MIVGSEHIRSALDRGRRPGGQRACGAARGGRRAVGAAAARAGAGRAARRRPRNDPPNPGNAQRAPPRRGQRGAAGGVSGRRRADRCLLRQADREQGRAGADRRAARGGRPRGDRRLRARPAEFEQQAEGMPRAVHRAVRAPASGAPAGVRRRRRWCRRSSPRRSGWSPPSRRRPAARRSSPGTPGWRRWRPGWSRPTRTGMGQLASFPSGDSAELAERIDAILSLPADRPGRAARGGAPGRASSGGAGRASPSGSSPRARRSDRTCRCRQYPSRRLPPRRADVTQLLETVLFCAIADGADRAHRALPDQLPAGRRPRAAHRPPAVGRPVDAGRAGASCWRSSCRRRGGWPR